MNSQKRGIRGGTIVLATALSISTSVAQHWPARPVTIVVPTAAGTGMDTLVRAYSKPLSQDIGQPVIVENKPGAALTLAAAHVAAAPADGYTLLISTATPMVVAPVLFKQLRYNPKTDLKPILVYAKSPFVLVATPGLKATGFESLLKVAKARNAPLSYASTGSGSSQHLSMEFLKQRFNFEGTHVPYKSSPQSIQDIAAGHVAMGFVEAGVATPLIREGRLIGILSSSAGRLPKLPDVPTIAEAISQDGFEAVSWHVLAAPAKTPAPIIKHLHAALSKIMQEPSMRKRIEDIGLMPVEPASAAATEAYLASEAKKWGDLVRKLGMAGSQ